MNKSYVYGCFKWIVNHFSRYYTKDELPDDLKKRVDIFYQSISQALDWDNLSLEDAKYLGFLCLEDIGEDSIWFFPTWMYPLIPEGLTVYDMSGNRKEFHRDTMSSENLYGCLSYGLVFNDGNF